VERLATIGRKLAMAQQTSWPLFAGTAFAKSEITKVLRLGDPHRIQVAIWWNPKLVKTKAKAKLDHQACRPFSSFLPPMAISAPRTLPRPVRATFGHLGARPPKPLGCESVALTTRPVTRDSATASRFPEPPKSVQKTLYAYLLGQTNKPFINR